MKIALMTAISIILGMLLYLPFYVNSVPLPDNFYVADLIRAQFIIRYGHDITELTLTSTFYFLHDVWMKHNLYMLDSKPFTALYLAILYLVSDINLNYLTRFPFMYLLGVLFIYIIFSKIIIFRKRKIIYFLTIIIPIINYSIYVNIVYYRSLGYFLLFLFLMNYIIFITNYEFRKQNSIALILIFLSIVYTYYSTAYYVIVAIILSIIISYFTKLKYNMYIRKNLMNIMFVMSIILIMADATYYNVINNFNLNNIVISFTTYINKVYNFIFKVESFYDTTEIIQDDYINFARFFNLINNIVTILIIIYFLLNKFLRSTVFNYPLFFYLLIFFSSIGILYSLGYSAVGFIASSIPALLSFISPLLIIPVLNFLEARKSLPLLIIWVLTFLLNHVLYYLDPSNPFSYSNRYIIVQDCLTFPLDFLKPNLILVSTHTCTAHISLLMTQILRLDTATTLMPYPPKYPNTSNTAVYIPVIYNNSNIDFAGWNIKYVEKIIDLLLANRNIVYYGMNGILIIN